LANLKTDADRPFNNGLISFCNGHAKEETLIFLSRGNVANEEINHSEQQNGWKKSALYTFVNNFVVSSASKLARHPKGARPLLGAGPI